MMKLVPTPFFVQIQADNGEEYALDDEGRIWACQKVGEEEWGWVPLKRRCFEDKLV
jgi:hypothetical protein